MNIVNKFVKVIPNDYKRMMEIFNEHKEAGLTDEDAVMRLFKQMSHKKKKLINDSSDRNKKGESTNGKSNRIYGI